MASFSFGEDILDSQSQQDIFSHDGVDKALRADWDPLGTKTRVETPSPQCLTRIRHDLRRFNQESPPPGIFVFSDETNIMIIHALIIGPRDTPYEGGFFYFYIKFPTDYPIRPPRIRLMTTGGGRVRFNPNIYQSGKVCLSILGTWVGPPWSPALTLMGVLVSIQSLLNDKPYHNEPGFEVEKVPGDVESYNKIIIHETLRVAVCGMLENETRIFVPESLVRVMESHFVQNYKRYVEMTDARLHLDGQNVDNPFRRTGKGTFQYVAVRERLERIYVRLTNKKKGGDSGEAMKCPEEVVTTGAGEEAGSAQTI